MDWQNWCRLCGNFDTISKIDAEIIEIMKNLNTQVKFDKNSFFYDNNNILICFN